jgi:hypothetical protein
MSETGDIYDCRRRACECCGRDDVDAFPYGEADSTGYLWTHYACTACQSGCTSDEEGRPVHLEGTR